MKPLLVAAAAVIVMTTGGALADQAATMPVEIVSQDTINTGADGGILVPILTMIFMLLVSNGNGGFTGY